MSLWSLWLSETLTALSDRSYLTSDNNMILVALGRSSFRAGRLWLNKQEISKELAYLPDTKGVLSDECFV